jgi:hypothetical protein
MEFLHDIIHATLLIAPMRDSWKIVLVSCAMPELVATSQDH